MQTGGVMSQTKADKSRQAWAYKPLSVEQESAIDLLVMGKSDGEVGDAVGVTRQTVWGWRHDHPLFLATLNRRRQDLWRAPQERLRSLAMKAVENLAQAVEEGKLHASLELLKAIGLYGQVPPIGPTDPEAILAAQVEAHMACEAIPKTLDEISTRAILDNPRYAERLADIEAALRAQYCESASARMQARLHDSS
jgi:hypothetical protein